MATEMRIVPTLRIHDREHILCHDLETDGFARWLTSAQAAVVDAQTREAVLQRVDLRLPGNPADAGAMDHDDGRTIAGQRPAQRAAAVRDRSAREILSRRIHRM
jgi:hypothetical protein